MQNAQFINEIFYENKLDFTLELCYNDTITRDIKIKEMKRKKYVFGSEGSSL
jgi:hypothetical protein